MKRYFAISFGLAWVLMVGSVYGAAISPVFSTLLSLGMFAPLIGAAVSCKGLSTAKSGIHWGLSKGKIGWYALALLLPSLLTLLGGALYFALFPHSFDPAFSSLPPTGQSLPAVLLISALAAPFFNMIFALGEEVGWRGYMTPRLTARFGQVGGKVLAGIIWSVWHWPLILLGGYEYGVGYPGAPFTGLAAMCLFTTALGIVLSWLYEKSGTIWAPALAHGALNAIGALPLYAMNPVPSAYLLGPAIAGVISVLPTAVLAVVVLLRNRK